MYNVRDASATGFYAHVEFASRSGKQSIYASLQFDADTGRFTTIHCPTPGATQPLSFAKAVERKIAERN
ncbi:hypothetical protein GCM10009641_46860 [Mycobacterium cookii]|uniref:Uncharacterized protein n=1 Tax=Nocardioides furvisabuli TaxID=375542 RepID=A0ABN2XQ69_9ACTN|nr:hypothetical protein [Nocardioides furvisabuli]